MELAFTTVSEHYVLATWRNVGIAVWVDETSVDTVLETQYMLENLYLAWPQGVAFLQVLGEEHGGLDGPTRNALKALLRSGHEHIREAPVVYEGSGFRAASIRGIVTGLLSQRAFGFPHRVYSSIDDAALAIGRCFERREPARFARELCEALAGLRDRHRREFPSAPHSFIRYRG